MTANSEPILELGKKLSGETREALIKRLMEWMLKSRTRMQYSMRVYWNVSERFADEEDINQASNANKWMKKERHVMMRIGFIFNSYHVDAWWYQIWDLIRKLCLTCALVFLRERSVIQTNVALVICFASFCLNLRLQPDPSFIVQWFTNLTLLLLCYTLVIGNVLVCMEERGNSNEEVIDHMLFWPTVMIYLAFIGCVCIRIRLVTWICKRWKFGQYARTNENRKFVEVSDLRTPDSLGQRHRRASIAMSTSHDVVDNDRLIVANPLLDSGIQESRTGGYKAPFA
ncbi:hypothetical protein CYMTET_54777 [Cymbomonas tetramitiformis]|uniref:Uncharacterized protein n=1 Tax=Cymbomonas tetramitiformis TaxID=36881 RepID=A0AAE0BE77_9CHLO|nr:hypothetical protein CYMTET_54777 [Cymbomonas tetramitiformis]